MPATPWQERPVRLPAREVVEDLVRRRPGATRRAELVHVVDVEIADAPARDLPGRDQPHHLLDDLGERRAPAPVQQVEIEAVGAEAAEAAFARLRRSAPRRVLRIDLAHQEDVVAPSADGFADDLLGPTLPVHLRGVDEREAEIETEPERRHLGRAFGGPLAHAPGSESEPRQRVAHRADCDRPPAVPPGGRSAATNDEVPWSMRSGVGPCRIVGCRQCVPSRAATGQDAGSTFANPLLAAPGSGDFHLATGSPAINAGDPGFTPAVGEVVQLHESTEPDGLGMRPPCAKCSLRSFSFSRSSPGARTRRPPTPTSS
jgi:hypothetical protein